MTAPASLDGVAEDLVRRLPDRVERDASLAELTTYRLGGPAAVLVRAASVADVVETGHALDGRGVPLLVVGRGSNLLVADAGFRGVVLVLGGDLESVDADASTGRVAAGGGTPLPVLARRTAGAGLSGLEFYVGIPGTVGGAVRMNAGGHGRETREVLLGASVVELGRDAPEEWDVARLGFGYRHSALGPASIVVGATFAATPDDAAACASRIDEIVRWRREHQPGGANAGSVFRNPPGDAAGRLVEASGLKGHRIGGAFVSEKHANFIQAEPGARAADVRDLVLDVARRVEERTGVRLERELHFVGFDEVAR